MSIIFGTVLIGLIGGAQSAFAVLIDFDGLDSGTEVTNQFAGVTVSANNPNNSFDVAVIFDSHLVTGNDADLTGPGCTVNCDGNWDGGNLAPSTDLQKIIIVPENGQYKDDPPNPNDEADPGVTITFAFDSCVDSFGWDMIDQEPGDEVEMGLVKFFNGNTELATVQFEDLDMDSDGPFGDDSVNFGDNHANRISPVTAAALGISGFNKVMFKLGGSGGFDNINYQECLVGGSGFEIDKTSLLVAGVKANSSLIIPMIIPMITGVIVVGIFIVRRR